MLEVPHPAGSPQDCSQASVEAFRPSVARTAHKIIGDLLHPVLQCAVESLQGRQSQSPTVITPLPQPLNSLGRRGDAPILEDTPKFLSMLGQTAQFRKPLLQSPQFRPLLA